MPDAVPILQRHHKLAISEVDRWLPQIAQASRLTEVAVQSTYSKRDFVAGWHVPTEFSGTVRSLHLLIDHEFPYNAPRVALVNPPPFLTWPHVEADGVLCLQPRAHPHDPVTATKQILGEAFELISNNLANPDPQDFRDEFLSYWLLDPRTKGDVFLSLLVPRGPSKRVAIWRCRTQYIVAETHAALQSWSQNRFGGDSLPIRTAPAALLWLPEPMVPDQYPTTASDIWALASTSDRLILRDLAAASPKEISVVLGAKSTNGPCFAGATVFSPASTLPGRSGPILQNGFRKGKTPDSILAHRYWNTPTPVARSNVTRADASWVHGRDRDTRQKKLSNASVVVIGAGSIGAPVAIQLAMAGVGRLLIIDPKKLTVANTGRHPLGAKYVGTFKAEALARDLRENYPHHQFDSRTDSWQTINSRESTVFTEASLIVSATGDWDAEDALNVWHISAGKSPPIVYGWTEEYACAGHAVLITPRSEVCLGCGLGPEGKSLFHLTSWPSPTLNQEPGCGALYQPYGPIEIGHSVSLIAELAIHALLECQIDSVERIWACPESFLLSCGGQWTSNWLAHCGQRTEGGFLSQRKWPSHKDCVSCQILQIR
jgi:ubiquitin-protein ligase